MPGRDFATEIPNVAAAVANGAFDVRPRSVPLADVEQTWAQALRCSDRIDFVP